MGVRVGLVGKNNGERRGNSARGGEDGCIKERKGRRRVGEREAVGKYSECRGNRERGIGGWMKERNIHLGHL